MVGLVDANILVYTWEDPSEPKKQLAIDFLAQHKGDLIVSVQNLSEFASVMLHSGRSHGWVGHVLREYAQAFDVHSVSSNDVAEAVRIASEHTLHFWDAQLCALAKRQGVPYIFSEDGPTGQTAEGVTFRNPLLGGAS